MIQKPFLRIFTFFHILLYRLTRGKLGGRMNGLPVLLLRTVGRKTGKQRVTPLGYFVHEGNYVITGSNAGMNSHPGWYYNLTANPQASIQVNGDQCSVVTEVAGQDQRDRLWDTLARIAPAYKNYPQKLTRDIPMVLLRVHSRKQN
ncbi:MAG: nitroreductase family deazaflavin-dependent oxidoreductase [Chloroflexi bacterium CFX2]|nr:nitroreductase family deazaflavin-dependent oxidoreductase [Chloroflexi bacterium CFX2]